MTMEAAAGSGGDVQDRLDESIAKDSADGNDSCFFRVTNFFLSFVDAAVYRTSKLRRGYGRRPRLSSCMTTTGHYERTCSQALHVPKGMCVEVLACVMDPMQVFPAGRAVFQHKRRMELVELSGRTTRRLGYNWPTTAYAIGGTAPLALRYSIIPATTAARTRPQ